ncbi:MAG: metallophosphoesterase [Hyphomicrobiales bacterium]|nr:metallophosphoesterase [Hyphomicrobiales bacterium]
MAGISYHDARGPEGAIVYAIGDVHGRLDLLEKMHDTIAAEVGGRDWRIVHLGDYVDRGPDSCGVIDLLAKRTAADSRVLALAGNHDLGFLDFLAQPDPAGLFASYGGVQTAQSYGVTLDLNDAQGFASSAEALVRAVPHSHRNFLGALGFSVAFGDFFFCHAGIRPGIALDAQDKADLIWIRGDFHRYRELHPKVVVHGHTPVAEPEVLPNRVNLDTGAFSSGRLSALVIDGAQKRLLTVEI